MPNNQLSPAIVDAIANTNIDVLGNAPAVSVAQVYQVLAHSISLSMQSAQANSAGLMQIGNAVVGVAVAQIVQKM